MGLFTEPNSVTPFITLVSTTLQGIIHQMILIFILLRECKLLSFDSILNANNPSTTLQLKVQI